MLKDLERRCGLRFSPEARDLLAEVTGDFPFWMRLAGSYVHRATDIESRPVEVSLPQMTALMADFLEAEGTNVGRVALENLSRLHPEAVELLKLAISEGSVPLRRGSVLVGYGLARQVGHDVSVSSEMIRSAVLALPEKFPITPGRAEARGGENSVSLSESEWAEELATISRRRNVLERRLREMVRFGLKMQLAKGENWTERVRRALPAHRRSEVASLAADALMEKLYWKELEQIVSKEWSVFQRTIGDKTRFQLAMALLNDRPDAHAKEVDAADIALHRRELVWLEERVAG